MGRCSIKLRSMNDEGSSDEGSDDPAKIDAYNVTARSKMLDCF